MRLRLTTGPTVMPLRDCLVRLPLSEAKPVTLLSMSSPATAWSGCWIDVNGRWERPYDAEPVSSVSNTPPASLRTPSENSMFCS